MIMTKRCERTEDARLCQSGKPKVGLADGVWALLIATAIAAAGAKAPFITPCFVDLLIEAARDLLRACDQQGIGSARRQCRFNGGTNASRGIPVDAIDVIAGTK